MNYFFTFIILVIGLLAQDPDHWHNQIMLGEMAVCLWLSFEIKKRIHLIPALAFLYFSMYSVYCCFAKTSFSLPSQDIQAVFDGATARSLCFLLLVSVPFIFSSKKDLCGWLTAFKIFAIADCFVMFYSYLFLKEPNGWVGATGMIGMDSVDGTFLCLMLPFFFYDDNLDKEDKALCLTSIFSALMLTKSSTVFGLLCIFATIAFFKWNKWTAVLPIALCYPIGKYVLGRDLLLSNGRGHVLKISYEMFRYIFNCSPKLFEKASTFLFGLGSSSWLVTMPQVQGTNHTFFIWMHDEPAQVMFEQGALGLILMSSVYFYLLYLKRNNTMWTMVLLGLGFQSFLQPSFRYFLFAIFLVFIIRSAFEKEDEQLILTGEAT